MNIKGREEKQNKIFYFLGKRSYIKKNNNNYTYMTCMRYRITSFRKAAPISEELSKLFSATVKYESLIHF
jgi:hypothetical protein